MKTIHITGKHNQDKMSGVDNPTRAEANKYKFDINTYTHKKQIDVLNNLYLENEIDNKKEMIGILNRNFKDIKHRINKRIYGILINLSVMRKPLKH